MSISHTDTLTMNRKDLKEIIGSINKQYESIVREKVNDAVNRVIRDNNVWIYCGKCGKNILFENEPTVFVSKSKDKSRVYHMECWRQL